MAITNVIISKIIEIGPVIIIPSILFLVGFITTRNPLRNLKNSTFIFAGMLGFAILLTLFINFFKPLIDTIILNSPKNFEIIDIGWAASKEIILNSPITLQIIIGVFSLNIIMLLLRFTRTINIDIWNYWIFLLVGSIIFTITEIEWVGVLIALIVAAITLVLADIYAPFIGNYFGIKGVSIPQTQVVTWAPVSQLVNFIFNKIPGVSKAHIFYKGLNPAINDIREFINRRITKRVLYVGIDSIFFAGMPSIIGLSIIIIPLTAYISTILPGNKILPSADLIIIPFLLTWAVALSQGDIFRSFVSAVIIIPLMLWISTDMGTLFTSFFQKYNIALVETHKSISSFGSGSNLLFWILLQIIKPILNFFA